MKEQICGNCHLRVNGRCIPKERPVAANSTCADCDTGEEENNIEEESEAETEPCEEPEKIEFHESVKADLFDEHSVSRETNNDMEANQKKTGLNNRQKADIDIPELTKLYTEGMPTRQIAKHFKVNPSTITNRVNVLIASGRVVARALQNNNIASEAEACAPELAVSDNDLQFIRDLMDGAEKVVIYRKAITVTIEFKGD